MLTTHFIINSPVVASPSRSQKKTGPATEVAQHCPGKIREKEGSRRRPRKFLNFPGVASARKFRGIPQAARAGQVVAQETLSRHSN